MTPEVRVGDEVIIRGKVTATTFWWFSLGGSVMVYLQNLRGDGVTVEVVSPPEPEYEVGAVYQDAVGKVWYRMDRHWRNVATGIAFAHEYPARPLVRLVPERTDET